PLCRAVRSASAAGITVVVAAGNFGRTAAGQEAYGTVSAPGNDPSVITVGSVNPFNTAARSDDAVNRFSSRGPTRGVRIDAHGVRQIVNLLKADLVAPGNKIVGAMATEMPGDLNNLDSKPIKNPNALARKYQSLPTKAYTNKDVGKTAMYLSGTSIAAPAVAG